MHNQATLRSPAAVYIGAPRGWRLQLVPTIFLFRVLMEMRQSAITRSNWGRSPEGEKEECGRGCVRLCGLANWRQHWATLRWVYAIKSAKT